MPTYIPFHTVVTKPLQDFMRIHKDQDLEVMNRPLEEAVREAISGDLHMYRHIIDQSAGYAFYRNAPEDPHWIIAPDNSEPRYLFSAGERETFYHGLSDAEKISCQKKIRYLL